MLQYPLSVPTSVTNPLVEKILFLSKVVETVPVTSQEQGQIFHRQIVQSSFFSAKIEGNTGQTPKEKKEIENCERALRMIKTFPPSIDLQQIQQIHSVILDEIDIDAGKFRVEQSGVFNSSGVAVYVTPDRQTLDAMLSIWIEKTNRTYSVTDQLVNSALLHYYFEKIHPFIDGNGRTGRILLQWCIRRSDLFGENILPIDLYFDMYRSTYYAYLEQNTRHVEEFVRFTLEGVIWSLERMLSDIKNPGDSTNKSSSLLPRREELLAIITDHPVCSFDFLSRRFPMVSVRTLAYDLEYLVKNDYIKKHGQTRGVRYSARKP